MSAHEGTFVFQSRQARDLPERTSEQDPSRDLLSRIKSYSVQLWCQVPVFSSVTSEENVSATCQVKNHCITVKQL